MRAHNIEVGILWVRKITRKKNCILFASQPQPDDDTRVYECVSRSVYIYIYRGYECYELQNFISILDVTVCVVSACHRFCVYGNFFLLFIVLCAGGLIIILFFFVCTSTISAVYMCVVGISHMTFNIKMK